MLRWYGWLTWREPFVFVHWGYGWVAAALLLLGCAIVGIGLSKEDAVHALTTGAIGVMTLGVMTRASLGPRDVPACGASDDLHVQSGDSRGAGAGVWPQHRPSTHSQPRCSRRGGEWEPISCLRWSMDRICCVRAWMSEGRDCSDRCGVRRVRNEENVTTLPVFQEMFIAGAGDPVIVADAVQERVLSSDAICSTS